MKLLKAEKMGPIALAKAPSDLNIPKIVPFCSTGPILDATVVKHVTTVDEEYEYKVKLK